MAEKKVNYDRDDFESWDFYITGGRRAGRILACKKPFHRGDGIYKQTMDLKDWRVLGNKSLTEEELIEYIEKIRDANVKGLRDTVYRHKPEGYKLLESPNGYFQVTRRLDS